MSRNGSGTYSLPESAFVFDTVISETAMNSNLSDIATALTGSIAKDGQTTPTANLPMGTYKHTGVGAGSAATDSANLGQVQAEAYIWCGTMTGTADAGVLTPSPAITAYAAGQRFVWVASANVNTTAMTVAVSGLTTIAVQNDGAALAAGDHAASKLYMGILDTTSTIQITRIRNLAALVTADIPAIKSIEQNSQSAAYTTVLTDMGKHIYHPSADTTARIWTIDSNANVPAPIGSAITFVNDTSGGVITIAITTDTLVLSPDGTTGSRTLAANGVATAIKVTATRWLISGAGLT